MNDLDVHNLDHLANTIELPDEFDGLPTFTVGGCVRDTIRGTEPNDIDLLVCEVSPEEMRDRGFREIDSPNNDTFGVFQDRFGREVALPREESSTGPKHKDFDVQPVAKDVAASDAIERDAMRRDFTVNSLYYDLRWDVLLDPQNGLPDLEEGVVRAVDSKTFQDDPLRVLRGCRYAARLDARIDETTKSLMRGAANRIPSLPEERIRMETTKTFVQAETPSQFFELLDSVDALETCFPVLNGLKSVPAGPKKYHQEGSAFRHSLLCLDEMKKRRPNDSLAMLMSLVHDYGKIETDYHDLPRHPGHTKSGIPIVEEMADRLSMSRTQKTAMRTACRDHMKLMDAMDLRESTVIDMFQRVDSIERLIDLVHADNDGRRPSKEWNDSVARARFDAAKQACDEWTGQRLIENGYDPDEMGGEEFGNLLRQKRVERMREIESKQNS